MPVCRDDLKVKKEPVIQKVEKECCRQKALKQTQRGKDIGLCCPSMVGKEEGEKRGRGNRAGSHRTC